jgi:hypothetical protein
MTLDSINSITIIIGLICAIIFPIIRYKCRKNKDIKPYFQLELLRHDAPAGFALPQYFLLLISPHVESIETNVITMSLYILYAIILIFSDLLDNGRSPCMRTRSTDNKLG